MRHIPHHLAALDAVLSGQALASIGDELHGWVRDLFPICRSLTGPGVRATLAYLAERLPGLVEHQIPTGTRAFDWTVPPEWTIRDAYVADESGRRLIDFRKSNLHVIGYSEPVDRWMRWEELQPHLHSLPALPNAIPYITSYYERAWGFCLSHHDLETFPREGAFHVVIDSSLSDGNLSFADILIPGESQQEVLLSTYVCHPSMANNELSGPVVATAIGRWIAAWPKRRYSYRIVFVPETIGSVVYLSRHLESLRKSVVAGFVLTCIGDERGYSTVLSRKGNTLADRVAMAALREISPEHKVYSFLERGSDERQYCSPGVDLPVATLMRSKFGCYPEYHTSLDDCSLVTPAGLAGGFDLAQRAVIALEGNCNLISSQPCEPQLGKRGLYPSLSTPDTHHKIAQMMNVLAFADGENDCLAISEITGVPLVKCMSLLRTFEQHGLIKQASSARIQNISGGDLGQDKDT